MTKWAALVVFLFTIVSCNSPDLSERAPVHYTDAKTRPVFLMGRLPGPRWKEHNPPKMNARQSFEGYNRYEPCILALFSRESEQDAETFLRGMTDRLTGVSAKMEPPFDSGEGKWAVMSFKLARSDGQVRIYALQKAGLIYWVQLTAPNSARFSLCVPDTQVYLKNLWFLYDE